jgi:C_GCAxxG_C_C family probable redox protein
MARTAGVCGAVSGGMMAINLQSGISSPRQTRDENYTQIQKFLKAFENKFGATNCEELTGCDLGTDEGQKSFLENNCITRCHQFVEEATRLAIKLR